MNTMPPDESEAQRSRNTMIFAIVSSIIVVVGMIALIVIGILPRFTSPARSLDDADGPFLTLKRPVPSSTNLYDIFPVQVGDFVGQQWLGDVAAGFTVTYKRGTETLTITGRQAVNFAAARFLVEDLRTRFGPANRAEKFTPGQFNNNYYLSVYETSTRFAWNRDVWFFDVQAASLESLTAFMNIFPY